MTASSPVCPICDAATVRLTATKGPRSGTDFWGCTRYRENGCPGKINVGVEEATAAPIAGASAQATFERKRAIHRAKLRAALPGLTALSILLIAIVFFALLALHPALAAGGAVVMGIVCVYGITHLPSEALWWDKGARGERKTLEILEPLIRRGFIVLSDRRIPGRRGNIDQIAIGPSGVYVIETKNLSGVVEVTNDKLFISDQDRQAYIDEVYREALATQVALSELLNPLRVTVTPVLCIHGARMPWFDHAVA